MGSERLTRRAAKWASRGFERAEQRSGADQHDTIFTHISKFAPASNESQNRTKVDVPGYNEKSGELH